jgi:hypothetical protein
MRKVHLTEIQNRFPQLKDFLADWRDLRRVMRKSKRLSGMNTTYPARVAPNRVEQILDWVLDMFQV